LPGAEPGSRRGLERREVLLERQKASGSGDDEDRRQERQGDPVMDLTKQASSGHTETLGDLQERVSATLVAGKRASNGSTISDRFDCVSLDRGAKGPAEPL
jgi:hypothetical protein